MSSGQGSIIVNQKREGAWTYVVLATTFTTNLLFTNGAADNVPGLFFTPLQNKRYEIEGKLIVQSSALTTGPRPGAAWPTAGVVTNSGWYVSTGATTVALFTRFNGGPFKDQIAATAIPIANAPFHIHLEGLLITDNLIAGSYQIIFNSEIAGSNVSMMAGSFIKFREY